MRHLYGASLWYLSLVPLFGIYLLALISLVPTFRASTQASYNGLSLGSLYWHFSKISFLQRHLYGASLWVLSLVPLFGTSFWDLSFGTYLWGLSLVPILGPLPRHSIMASLWVLCFGTSLSYRDISMGPLYQSSLQFISLGPLFGTYLLALMFGASFWCLSWVSNFRTSTQASYYGLSLGSLFGFSLLALL